MASVRDSLDIVDGLAAHVTDADERAVVGAVVLVDFHEATAEETLHALATEGPRRQRKPR